MPTFKIEYAMDVPAYGETLIHARSLKQAEAEARKLYKEGTGNSGPSQASSKEGQNNISPYNLRGSCKRTP